MTYDFNTLINRKNDGSSKWDLMDPNTPDDIVPLSVADSDMPLAPEIKNGLIEYLNTNAVFGYSKANCEYYQAIINWMEKRHQYKITEEMIVVSNGIVPALYDAIRAFSNKGDGVIIFSPIYHPFYQAIETNNREVITCPLINKNGNYTIDFEQFEKLAKETKNKLLLLCSPHNPISRVWTKAELQKIANICLDNDIIIISDEIHADLIMPGYKHYPLASLNSAIENITITCTAPSKSFNLAGLQGSNILIKNPILKKQFILQQEKRCFHSLNTIAYKATILAYNYGEKWLDEFIELINNNYQLLTAYLKENMPLVKVSPLQGTYLAWLDFNDYHYDYKLLEKKMRHANLYFNEGYIFGEEGKGFERVNIACPKDVLLAALERLKNEFQK